jgi:hypothetical protein
LIQLESYYRSAVCLLGGVLCVAIDSFSLFCQVLSCLYGMDIRDAELASLERKRGGKAKKRKKKAEDDVATSFKEANAGALQMM